MIRHYTKIGLCVIGMILAVVFVVRGIIIPIAHHVAGGGSSDQTVQAQADTEEVQANSDAAVRQPLKGKSDTDKVAAMTAGWHEDANGKWYQNTDGTYFSNGFQDIDGVTYSFDENGYIQTGWVEKGVKDYYFNEDGSYDPSKVRPMLALTFDDGPGQYTGKLLDALEKYNARASFFMCGYSLKRTDIPVDKLLKRMDALGCDLGNHTMNHCALDKVSKSKRKYEINGVNELVKKAVGYNPKFLRPPYGSGIRDADVQKAAKMPIVCWSVDTLDWKTKSKKETVKSIMNSAKDGQIILMHDIHSWSVDAAIEAIPKLQKKGYQIVSVSEMAEAKGVKLKKGQPYFEFE